MRLAAGLAREYHRVGDFLGGPHVPLGNLRKGAVIQLGHVISMQSQAPPHEKPGRGRTDPNPAGASAWLGCLAWITSAPLMAL